MNDVALFEKLMNLKESIKQELGTQISNLALLINKANTRIDDTQDATCELSMDIDDRIADIENALCELSQ